MADGNTIVNIKYDISVAEEFFSGTLEEYFENLRGPAGADGANGIDGADGAPGQQGLQGLPGEVGPQGLPGVDGIDGMLVENRRWHVDKVEQIINPDADDLAYFPDAHDVRGMAEWPCDFILLTSTDHGEGGIYLYLCTGDPSLTANWKSYDQAVTDGDFVGVEDVPSVNPIYRRAQQMETPSAIFENGVWHLFTHQNTEPNSLGSQTTTLSVGQGELGLLRLDFAPIDRVALDYDPAEFPGNGHTGNAHMGLNPFPDVLNPDTGESFKYLATSIHGGTDLNHTGLWGTDTLTNDDGSATRWQRVAYFNSDGALNGLSEGGVMGQTPDFGTIANGLSIQRGVTVGSGIDDRPADLYQVQLGSDGGTKESDVVLVMPRGVAGSFDELEIGFHTSLEFEGKRVILYTGVDASGKNSIGSAIAELKPHNQPMPSHNPPRVSSTYCRHHDFRTDQRLPNWLEISGNETVSFGPDGVTISSPNGEWMGLSSVEKLIPADVGQLAITLIDSFGTDDRVPLIGAFAAGAVDPNNSPDRVSVVTLSNLDGVARLQSHVGGSLSSQAAGRYDWGFANDEEVGSKRDIGMIWIPSHDRAQLRAGQILTPVDQIDTTGVDKTSPYELSVKVFNDSMTIGAITIEYGDV